MFAPGANAVAMTSAFPLKYLLSVTRMAASSARSERAAVVANPSAPAMRMATGKRRGMLAPEEGVSEPYGSRGGGLRRRAWRPGHPERAQRAEGATNTLRDS